MLISFGLLCLAGVVAGSAAVLTISAHTMQPERGVDDDDDDGDRMEAVIDKLKAELFALSAEEAANRFGAILPDRPAPPRQDKVDHFVVLYMENHAADHLFGCMDLPGFDGIPSGGHQIPHVPGAPALGSVNISCGTADYVCTKGPTYDKFTSKFSPLGEVKASFYPYGEQDDKYSYLHGLEAGSGATAVRMYAPSQIPVKAALARSFGVFNK